MRSKTSMKDLSIAAKIWLSISVPLLGYLVSSGFGYYQGIVSERRLYTIGKEIFPAHNLAERALNAFTEQSRCYEDAIMFGDLEKLDQAQLLSEQAQTALFKIVDLPTVRDGCTTDVNRNRARLLAYSKAADAFYRKMAVEPDNIDEQRLSEASRLTQTQRDLKWHLEHLNEEVVGLLHADLTTLQTQSINQRNGQVAVFIIVVLVTLGLVSQTIQKFTLQPLARLMKLTETGLVGDQREYSRDEIGTLANKFTNLLERQQTTMTDLRQQVAERQKAEADLHSLNDKLETLVQERTKDLEAAQTDLLAAARQAGMAEVASDVLHNVGNVLNSIGVTCSTVTERTRNSKIVGVGKISEVLENNRHDIAGYLSGDESGRKLPQYIRQLSEHLTSEQSELLKLLDELTEHVEHVKSIIAVQQVASRNVNMEEDVDLIEIVDDALKINLASFQKYSIEILCEFPEDLSLIYLDRHKLLQILTNLISNARNALIESERNDPQLTISVQIDDQKCEIEVSDNGMGIAPENLDKVFAHGFTTRKKGFGFGLHSSANVAAQMNGQLSVSSRGKGQGASFRLQLPMETVSRV